MTNKISIFIVSSITKETSVDDDARRAMKLVLSFSQFPHRGEDVNFGKGEIYLHAWNNVISFVLLFIPRA